MARDRPALAEDTQPVCQGFEASPANKAARPGGNLTHEVKQAAIFTAGENLPATYENGHEWRSKILCVGHGEGRPI